MWWLSESCLMRAIIVETNVVTRTDEIMNQEKIIKKLSDKMKLVRVENNYTQDRMATILGISKKTLIQIEKRRTDASWTTIVALCALFRDSEIIKFTIGRNSLDILIKIIHQ